MTITANHIYDTANAYLVKYPNDKPTLSPLYEVIRQAGDAVTSRKEFQGHVTVGVVLARSDSRVLAIEHQVLHKWLLPGGHIENNDPTLCDAALRELLEETGISGEQVNPAGNVPLHIDVHPIVANDKKGEPEHLHFDFRFLFRTTSDAVNPKGGEVTSYQWQLPEIFPIKALRSRLMTIAASEPQS